LYSGSVEQCIADLPSLLFIVTGIYRHWFQFQFVAGFGV